MVDDKIVIKIFPRDDGKDVLLSDFSKEIDAFTRALEQADILFSGRGRRTAEFRIVDLHHSQATVVIGAEPLEGSVDVRSIIADTFFSGLNMLSERPVVPPGFTAGLVGLLRDLASPIGTSVSRTMVSWGSRSTEISLAFKRCVYQVPLPDEREAGTVSGMMELVNLHNPQNTFRLYPDIGPNQINCRFTSGLFEDVKRGLGKYVEVAGEVFYRYGEKFTYRVDVEEIEVPDQTEAPTFEGLRGIAPNATGGIPSEEFVRELRNEW